MSNKAREYNILIIASSSSISSISTRLLYTHLLEDPEISRFWRAFVRSLCNHNRQRRQTSGSGFFPQKIFFSILSRAGIVGYEFLCRRPTATKDSFKNEISSICLLFLSIEIIGGVSRKERKSGKGKQLRATAGRCRKKGQAHHDCRPAKVFGLSVVILRDRKR